MTIPFNPFNIEWSTTAPTNWDALLKKCKRTNLLNTWQFAESLSSISKYPADYGIIHFHDKAIGIVLVHKQKKWGVFEMCKLYRGPLWIHDEIPFQMHLLVQKMLRDRYRMRRRRALSYHPELEDTPKNLELLQTARFTRMLPKYKTAWLDLTPSTTQLRKNLQQKWRNQLNKAEKSDLNLVVDTKGHYLDWLLDAYKKDKKHRNYQGNDPKVLHKLFELSQATQQGILCIAKHQDEPVAGIYLYRHGNDASYEIGWTGDLGRKLCAHHFLLWHGLLELKKRGVQQLDLGGIEDKKMPGVTHFKNGLGGQAITLVGGFV